ncbi:hypothetical protein CL621_01120 [archaeon]|nr:hypothetical protein [archaeon]|tara:strand:- start:5438 stop:6313 length:876 start_codon:yes stop_codon:yes gene_type:complete
MNIVAIPDLHLDKTFNVTYGNPHIWSKKPLTIVKSILETEKPDIVVFLGDVFNNSTPSYQSVFKFLKVIDNYDNCFIVSGNHDIPKTNKKSVMDYLSDYVSVIPRNTAVEVVKGFYAIGWCDTQTIFEKKLISIINTKNVTTIFLHAAYNNWDNEMDNVVHNNIIKLAADKDILLISGHEHNSRFSNNLLHLGSIMPMNIGELGKKYYWTSTEGAIEIKHNVGSTKSNDVILTRTSIEPQKDKPIYIKTVKNISSSDLRMEEKELDIDIILDFKEQALKEGFTKKFIKEYF